MNAGGIFTYSDGYNYNDDSYAFIECTLLKDVGTLKAGTLVPEALINVKSCKMKLNVEDKLYVVPFTFSINTDGITSKTTDDEDSDFDDDDEEASSSGSSEFDTSSDDDDDT